ncbi:MAG TPA: hemolysin family protein [Gemmatimonadales bacterium]
MTLLLLGLGIAVLLAGAVYELSLLAVSRAELTEAVTRRLRGGQEPLAWPIETERELAAAAATTSFGMVMLGTLFPALFSRESVLELFVLLLLLAVPITLLSGYLLPRWLSQGRAEHAVHLLRPLFRPWAALLRLVLPAASEATGEYRAFGRESAAVLPETDTEMAMVGGVMTFAQRPVREVLTPRTELVAVADGADVAEISKIFAESGYSRIPVYRETLDEIVGMVHAFDLFKQQPGDPLPIRPVGLAPASRTCGDVLVDMQRERRHLAVVLDEFGGTLGIVTLEDLLRALVGEIYDEDEPVAAPDVARPALLEIDGSLPVPELEASFGVVLPGGLAGTVGGRLAELAGRIPATGERLVLAGLEFDVLQASPTRVDRIVVRPGVPAPTTLGTSV